MTGPHPTGDQLAAYAEDTLGPVARAEVADHLATCHQCRREVQDLQRFLSLDQDQELLADADWPRAEQALEQGWRARQQRRPSWWRGAARRRVWVPAAAAAAAVLLLVVNLSRIADESPRGVPVRGAADEAVITLDEPVGEVAACPQRFIWTASDPDATYMLEIFTAELQPVASIGDLDQTLWTTDAAFCDSLEVGRRYLWSVQASHDGEVTARSAAQWFQITDGGAPAP